MPDEIVKRVPFRPGSAPVGLAAKKAALAMEQAKATGVDPTKKPEDMPERIGIVFDDSGSMYGTIITDAHAGVEEFLRSCDPRTTAVTVYPMNAPSLRLTTGLAVLSSLVNGINPTGSTPLVETLEKMVSEVRLTRAIVFSDGEPNHARTEDIVATCRETKLPVDTVYIGPGDSEFLRKLAEDTGGVYICLSKDKSNFRTAFKYLSPGFRAMLADKSFVSKLENGEV